MTDTLAEETVECIDDYISRAVAAAFEPTDAIVESVLEMVGAEAPEERLRAYAEARLRTVLAEHQTSQSAWREPTDCDRLNDAFAKLEAAGIVARQNFSCCQNCGSGEIWDEIDAREADRSPARGYTFYHCQDTESAMQGEGLCLSYGAVAEQEAASLEVGHEIVATLRAAGLQPEWDGTLRKRIKVPLVWRRRR